MDDLIIKLLLVILGFVLGMSGQIVVQVNMERRKKAAIRMRERWEKEILGLVHRRIHFTSHRSELLE